MNNLKRFFNDLGVRDLYRFDDLSDSGYSHIDWNELEDRIKMNGSIGFPLITSKIYDPEISKTWEPCDLPCFDTETFTFHMCSIRFANDKFLIKCEVTGSDLSNADGTQELSVKEIRKTFKMDKKFRKRNHLS